MAKNGQIQRLLLRSAFAGLGVAFAGLLMGPAFAQEPNPTFSDTARVQQAKELLGKRFHKVATAAEQSRKIEKYIHEITKTSLGKKYEKKAPKVSKQILKEAQRYGIDPIFIVSVIQTESSFNPRAIGTSGEIGLMQLMPDTAKWIAHEFKIKFHGKRTLYDPVMNVRIGAAYLSLLRERFGSDGRLYLPAYNMGPTAVRHAVNDEDRIPVDYAKRVMKKYLTNYAVIQEQCRQFLQLAEVKKLDPGALSHPQELPHARDDNT